MTHSVSTPVYKERKGGTGFPDRQAWKLMSSPSKITSAHVKTGRGCSIHKYVKWVYEKKNIYI